MESETKLNAPTAPETSANVPTTGEIVAALHGYFDRSDFAKDAICALLAADRLELLERTIAALTARAEQAERERDAGLAYITSDRLCQDCIDGEESVRSTRCAACYGTNGKPNFRYRGLPQDGEGK